MENDLVMLKDVNGQWVFIYRDTIFQALIANKASLWGMDLDAIQELRKQYLLRDGPLPVTAENIKKVFS